jgi:hypothetical protein
MLLSSYAVAGQAPGGPASIGAASSAYGDLVWTYPAGRGRRAGWSAFCYVGSRGGLPVEKNVPSDREGRSRGWRGARRMYIGGGVLVLILIIILLIVLF